MTTFPNSFDVADSGKAAPPLDNNAAGALSKFQDDSKPPTNYVAQAAEQNKKFPDEPPTEYVNQAAEQNKDIVLRNVEELLKRGEPVPEKGLHRFFQDDLESNLIANVSQVLARGNFMADNAADRSPIKLGIVGELTLPNPKDYWHTDNDRADVSKFFEQNVKAYKQEPEMVIKAIAALEQTLDQNLLDANLGKPLDVEQRDRVRQMAENAAMIKLAVATVIKADHPQGSKNLIAGSGHSVNDLLRIASDYGANNDNVQQLKAIVKKSVER